MDGPYDPSAGNGRQVVRAPPEHAAGRGPGASAPPTTSRTSPHAFPAPAPRPSARPSTPFRRVFVLAVLGNLLLAGGVGLAFYPVQSGTAALSAYEGLPPWARALLGEGTAGDEQGERGLAAQGPVRDWLERFLADSVRGDPAAQSGLPLGLDSPVPRAQWNGSSMVTVHWMTYGEPLRHEVHLVPVGAPLNGLGVPAVAVEGADRADVPMTEGRWDLVVTASHAGVEGTQERLGPFWMDPTGPQPPLFAAGRRTITTDSYTFSLDWEPASDLSGIGGYRLERSDDGVRFETVADLGADAREYVARNVPNGEYHFRLRAENGAGVMGAPTEPVRVVVDARGGLEPPGAGSWDHGINAVYDSVLHVWDISDPAPYLDLSDRRPDGRFGALSAAEYAHYTSEGWGVETQNETLRAIVRQVVGDETNTLEIGKRLFAWLFDATDYDFEKFNSADGGDFQRAGETLDRGLGICGDLTALYLTMLRIAGVPARPVHGYLINSNATDSGRSIGGFHMWAEVYVGAPGQMGGGWIPVDVSGVTGDFAPKHLDIYFGVANPDYLQLGVQEELGDDDLPLEDGQEPAVNRWNVWANLRWSYKVEGQGTPDLLFRSETTLTRVESTEAWLWFDPLTHARKVCPARDQACGQGFRFYYPDLNLRSVRQLDYGATVQWDDERVTEVQVLLRYPATPAPNQAAMFTPYQQTASCATRETTSPDFEGDGFIRWTLQASRSPCPHD